MRYHTFTLELLPHEAEFLLDGNVVRRYPDRLVPIGDPHADWVTSLARFTPQIYLGQMDLDIDAGYLNEVARHIQLNYPGCASGAAHEKIDYIKIYDIPDEVQVLGFPH